MSVRYVVGCMTGTSIDAIDAALMRIEGEGLAMRCEFIRGVSRPFTSASNALAPSLRALAERSPMSAGDIAQLARDCALAHAETVSELLVTRPGGELDRPSLIAVHGQTVFHAPPLSWQLFNPWPLVRAIGAPVVFDLRGADIAAGGQGAPITPIADWVLFRGKDESRAILNLGGFCNFTLIVPQADERPELEVTGGDICACNLLLDAIARSVLFKPFDHDGEAASAGEIHSDALEDLIGVLTAQAHSRRSLGTGDEALEWLSRWRAHVAPNDIAASACEAIGQTIARRVLMAHRVLLAGGGARNRALVNAIAGWSSASVSPLAELGIPGEFREAAEFGVLGALCADGVPITLPSVTGVRSPAPIAGCWAGLGRVGPA